MATGQRSRRSGARARNALSRGAYWSPVLVCMVLFAQVAFRGLRPALGERRRLAEAAERLDGRHARDLELSERLSASLRARADPIFLERRRRQRLHQPPSTETSGASAASESPGAE